MSAPTAAAGPTPRTWAASKARRKFTAVPEDRIRAALVYAADPDRMRRELDLALGQAWDDELEPFRYAGAGAPVRWLHRVG